MNSPDPRLSERTDDRPAGDSRSSQPGSPADRHAGSQPDRQTDRQTDRHAGSQTGSHAGGQAGRPPRPARPQITLDVLRREHLSPHLVRITLGGPGFAAFEAKPVTDMYVKIVFAKPKLGLSRPYDLAALRETLAPEDLPVTRTYTVRSVDHEAQTLSIDFVVHGDAGLAGPWANTAEPGDQLTFSGPGGAFAPDADAAWYLFAGDLSALPAIAAALEVLPDRASGVAFIEARDEADVIELTAPSGIEISWVFSRDAEPGTSTVLADAVAAAEWPDARGQFFAHGERSAMKSLRDLLRERGVTRDQLSLSGYWAAGRTEDRFQAEKREPIGFIAPVSD
ncbi:siderophore-interacting protein [Subtercola sp. YIM 133946]|uniref:siderophore-interacting protein n=1 Tax=Subtercola sp. YIM 133946 TaxID=3118909 RepID=UPI002F91DF69